MKIEEQEKIYTALKKIAELPKRELGGIYKDEVCNFKEMEQQRKGLTNLIVSPPPIVFDENSMKIHYPLVFRVVDNECSFGKSTVALQGIIHYYSNPHNRNNKVIWVTERIEDCEENAKWLNDITGIENFAVAITKNVPRFMREEYNRKYYVIIITHERYRRLSREYNKDERDSFQKDKNLMIIDEKLNMQNTITFCKSKHNELQEEIKKLVGKRESSKALRLYYKIVNPLLKYLNKTTKKDVYRQGIILTFQVNIKEIEETIDELKNLIKVNAKNDVIYENFEDKDYQTIYEKIEDLREFYRGRCIVDSMTYSKLCEVVIQVPNYSLNYWGLQNNIVLDATASIDLTYQYKEDVFQILHQKKVFNHKYWNIHCLDVNCTTYGRNQKYINFYDEINKIIKENGQDDFFVMANLYDDEEPTYKGSTIRRKKHIFFGTVGHIGNLNGRNDYAGKKNYINTDYIYENDRSYILKYLYYNRNAEIENWRSVQGKFLDEKLEEFKIYEVARNLYQSIKRINRDMKHISKVYFLSHRKEITELTLSMLDGANIIKNTGLEKRFIKVEKVAKSKENKKINQFKDLCKMILKNEIPSSFENLLEDNIDYEEKAKQGKFAKYLFYTTLEMSNKSFGNNVLNDKAGVTKRFLKDNGIINSKGKYLEFPNFSMKN